MIAFVRSLLSTRPRRRKKTRATTKAEREAIAAETRGVRGIVVLAALAVPLVAVAAAHVATNPHDFRPTVLR